MNFNKFLRIYDEEYGEYVSKGDFKKIINNLIISIEENSKLIKEFKEMLISEKVK